jgi:hypothetical protein
MDAKFSLWERCRPPPLGFQVATHPVLAAWPADHPARAAVGTSASAATRLPQWTRSHGLYLIWASAGAAVCVVRKPGWHNTQTRGGGRGRTSPCLARCACRAVAPVGSGLQNDMQSWPRRRCRPQKAGFVSYRASTPLVDGCIQQPAGRPWCCPPPQPSYTELVPPDHGTTSALPAPIRVCFAHVATST